MTKGKLLQVLLAEEPEIGCTCPDCDSTISWTLARGYLDLYEKRFGIGSATPATFRIGASSLIKPVLAALS